MAAPIKYILKEGDKVGECVYIKEDGTILVNGRNLRASIFKCFYCSSEFRASFNKVLSGEKKSCGGYKKSIHFHSLKHGKSKSCEYKIWQTMISRCNNVNNKRYPDYGGRGIKVCERWLESFENFYADMGDRPSIYLSIERIDNDGNYEQYNCYWGTDLEQANNKRNNHWITYNNKTLTLAQWSRELGIPLSSLEGRVARNLPLDMVFSNTPLKSGFKKGHKFNIGRVAPNATPFDVIFKVLSLYSTGFFLKSELAKMFKVDNATIGNFIKNKDSIIKKYELCCQQY